MNKGFYISVEIVFLNIVYRYLYIQKQLPLHNFFRLSDKYQLYYVLLSFHVLCIGVPQDEKKIWSYPLVDTAAIVSM